MSQPCTSTLMFSNAEIANAQDSFRTGIDETAPMITASSKAIIEAAGARMGPIGTCVAGALAESGCVDTSVERSVKPISITAGTTTIEMTARSVNTLASYSW